MVAPARKGKSHNELQRKRDYENAPVYDAKRYVKGWRNKEELAQKSDEKDPKSGKNKPSGTFDEVSRTRLQKCKFEPENHLNT